MKKILITGVTFGLGNYLTREFINDGYIVIGIDKIFPESLKQAITDKSLFFYNQDLSEIDDTINLLHQITKDHENIDVLINNAAILNFKFFNEYTYFEIVQKLNVNLISPIIIIKYFLECIVKNNYGKVINISSVSAFKGKETTSIYAVSKSGINRFHQVLVREMQLINKFRNVTINTICFDRIALPDYLIENPDVSAKKLINPEKAYYLIKSIILSEVNGKLYVVPKFNLRRLINDIEIIKKIPLLRKLREL